nr:putative RNA-directed DNA polymerase, eukaryota, reverse transcriptase zinc-binding domain protein [Tanacetum cinerariifolium]
MIYDLTYISTVSDYFVIDRGVWVKTGANLLIVAVYAPHDLKDKCLLWDYLTHVSNHWDGEEVMMGDFNEVKFKFDRFGSFLVERSADMFNSFIINASLEEVPLGGCAYTWCHKSASKMSKLDKFLISENLMHKCPNICAITLHRFISDHRLILLRESSVAPGDQSNGMRNMLFKLKFLKLKIREWINVFKNNSKAELIRLKEELQAVDGYIDNGNGSDEVVSNKTEIINWMLHLNKIKASEAAQKAKIKWSVEGDENSNLVKDEFVQHFSSRFGKPIDIRASIDMNFPKVLSSVQKEELECDVSKEELKRAVWDCGMDKYPGPDGFTFGFFCCNSSFIALIPKTPGANMVKDFRPISLIGCMYKIIAKILMNRLIGVIGDIVNEVQSAFIADRKILDGINLSPLVNLSHMFYADDAVFIGHWNDSSINILLESIRNRFFNGNDLGSKKDTWIKWSNVFADKAKWGLGVSSLYALNRESTLFWEDNWINGGVLKDVFPRLYALEMCKKVYVSLKLKDSSLETSFRRKVRGGAEQAQLDILSDMVREVGFVPMSDRQIARKVSSLWNVDYVDANSYEEWLDWFGSLRLPAKLKLMLEGVFYVKQKFVQLGRMA